MDIKEYLNEYGKEYQEMVFPYIPQSQYGNLETMFLYCFIRKEKLTKIAELGTGPFSRSSYVIQRAIEENGGGIHLMFDVPGVVETARKMLGITASNEGVKIFPGLIQHRYEEVDWREIDFLFIDADHVRDFAVWYLDNLIPKINDDTFVHIHDINLSANWKWREQESNEAEEIIERHNRDTLPMEKLLWFEDYCINPDYKERWNSIRRKYPFIGGFPALTEPFGCGASYWRKKSKL